MFEESQQNEIKIAQENSLKHRQDKYVNPILVNCICLQSDWLCPPLDIAENQTKMN